MIIFCKGERRCHHHGGFCCGSAALDLLCCWCWCPARARQAEANCAAAHRACVSCRRSRNLGSVE